MLSTLFSWKIQNRALFWLLGKESVLSQLKPGHLDILLIHCHIWNQPMAVPVEQASTCSPWRNTQWNQVCVGVCAWKTVPPWEAGTREGSWQALGPHEEEPTLEQICWQDFWHYKGATLNQTVPHGRVPCYTDLWTAVARGKGLCKKFVELCLPREGTPHRTRGRVWGNGGRDSVWQTNPLLFTACEEKVEKNGVQLSLGRILWEQERYFYLFIIILLWFN